MIELPSTIEGVTVHRRDAAVRRVADVGGLTVPTVAKLGPLPLTIHPASVRAVVLDADGALAPQAATVRVAVEPMGLAAAGDAEGALHQAVEDARRAVDVASGEVERLRADVAALTTDLEPVPRTRARTGELALVHGDREPVVVERRLELLAFRSRQLDLLTPALAAAQRVLRDATRAHHEAADRLRAHDARDGREHELVAVAYVTMQGAGSAPAGARLELSYLAAGATWRASHRLLADGSRSRLALGAVVTQRTGEDWSGVTLALATTEPSLQWQLPDLKPLRVGRAARHAVTGWRAPDPLPAELFEDFDRAQRLAVREQPFLLAAASGSTEELWMDAAEEDLEPGAFGAVVPAAMPVSMPPPPMQAMAPPPAPLPPQAPTASARSAAKGGLRRSRPSAPAAPGAPPPVRGGGPTDVADRELARRVPESAPPDPDRPDDAVADLDRLVLAGPTGADRGRPRPHVGPPAGTDGRAAAARQQAVDELDDDGFGAFDRLAPGADGLAFVYRVGAPVDIPSARAPSTIVVATAPAQVREEHVTVPYAATDVFRTLVLTSPFTVPVAAGPLEVSGPSGYLGPAEMPTITAGAEARVGIGIEEGIRVERQVDHRDDAKGLVRSSRVLEHHVTIRLTNRLATPATVIVRERVPVVPETEDRASVEELAVEPPWQPYRRDDAILRGGRQWSVTVEPAQVATLQARWQIVIPAKFELDGGNRR